MINIKTHYLKPPSKHFRLVYLIPNNCLWRYEIDSNPSKAQIKEYRQFNRTAPIVVLALDSVENQSEFFTFRTSISLPENYRFALIKSKRRETEDGHGAMERYWNRSPDSNWLFQSNPNKSINIWAFSASFRFLPSSYKNVERGSDVEFRHWDMRLERDCNPKLW